MKRILITAIAVCCFGALAGAQTKIYNEAVSHEGDFITLSFKVDADKGVPLRYKEVIMPYIYNGNDTLWFGTVEIFGRGRYLREKQEKYLAGDKKWKLGSNQTLADGIYTYTSQIPAKKWAKNATVGIKRHMTGCNCGPKKEDNHTENIKVDNVAPRQVTGVAVERKPVTYTLADVATAWDFGQDQLTVNFKTGKADFDPELFENRTTFGKILDAVDKIYADPRYKIEHIDIAGYASPDGGLKINYELAARRAQAMINYIISNRPQYGLTPDDFWVSTTEINWQGLREYISQMEIEEKDWILGIIDGDFTEERKIGLLRGLDRGEVWEKMYKEVFPHLRAARFTGVYYDSSRDDRARYLINEANDMIRQGRYTDAYNHLLHLKDDFRAYNTIGVALMMQGMYDEAMPWLDMAVESGCPVAQKNITAIKSALNAGLSDAQVLDMYMKKYE